MSGESTTPATTPDRIDASSVKFDPKTIGPTKEDKYRFLYQRLFGEFSETIKMPQETTVDEFKDWLKAHWKFSIKQDPALAAELNTLALDIVDAFGEDLYWKLQWAAKTMMPDEDPGARRHYVQGGQSPEKGAVGKAADPVNLFNGNFSYSSRDFIIDGAGVVFSFTRSYSQQASYNGPLGFKWDHNYNLWISAAADGRHITLSEGDLQLHHFTRHEVHDYFVPPDGKCAAIFPVNNSFELREPDGNKIIFEPHDLYHPTIHVASRVEDKFGNYLQFDYADGLLREVQVNLPERTISFFYDSFSRISRIRDFTGRTWSYSYDDLGDLSVVTTPATDEYPDGVQTRYIYSSYLFSDAAAQHNLSAIIDADGRTYLENEYGTDQGLVSYNRVVRQRQGAGDMTFDYADVVEDFDLPYAEHERPAHQTLVTDADGRQTRHLFNTAGNTILMETYARIDGIPKIVTTHYRYNRDGNLVGTLSPLGVVTQYLYGRDHYEKSHPQADGYASSNDADLTPTTRLGFNNLLAVVQRMTYYDVQQLSSSVGLWSEDIFPDIYTAATEDIVHKLTYEDEFAQITSSSDPRYTASADPEFHEDPDYDLHLTRYEYAPGNGHVHLTLASVMLPRPLLPDGNDAAEVVTRFTNYDDNGRLLRTVGPNGLEIVNEYYGHQDGLFEGFQRSVASDPGDLAIRYEVERDVLGRTTKQYRPKFFTSQDGRYVDTVEFNTANQVTRTVCTAPFSINKTFTYTRTGKQLRSTTELKDSGNQLTGMWEEINRYDDQLHLVRQLQGDRSANQTRTSRAVFDAAGRPYISLKYSGSKQKYTYNERGLKASAIADFGGVHAVTSFRYDADGRVVRTTDANGNTVRCAYDAAGRMTEQEDALGNKTITHFDKCGDATLHLIFEKVGPDAFVLLSRKEFHRDALNRVTVAKVNKFDTAPPVTESQLHTSFLATGPGDLLSCDFYFSATGQLYQYRDFDGQVYQSQFDLLGRRTKTIDPMGNEVSLAYDEDNNVVRVDRKEVTWNDDHTQVVQEEYFAQANRYDELNRAVEETNSLGNKVFFSYDSRGNLARLSGPLDTVCENEYDIFSRRVRKTDHLHNHEPGGTPVLLDTGYVYDAGDRVVQQIDPLGRVTRFDYDTMGRLLSATLPDDSADLNTYDKCGNIIEVRCRNNVVRRYRYNAAHRQVQCTVDVSNIDPGDTIEGAVLYETAYDALGRATRQENDFCRIENSYNSLSWNVRETTTYRNIPGMANPVTLTVDREFNATNALTGLRYPSGRTVAMERDALDRITSVSQVQKGGSYPGNPATAEGFSIISMRYDGLRRKRQTRSNGCQTEFGYDFGGRVTRIVHGTPAGPLLDCRYLYDALGNMRNRGEVTATSAHVDLYAFDSLSRLRSAQSSAGAAVDVSGLGPPLQPVPADIPVFQDLLDQRIAAAGAGTQYEYDYMGNRLSVSSATGTESYEPLPNDQYHAVNAQPLGYDKNGNLKEDSAFSYRYDHNNQLARTVKKSNGAEVQLFYDPLGRNCVQRSDNGVRVLAYNGYQVIEEYLDDVLVSSSVLEPGQDVPLLRSRNGREFYYCADLGHSTRLVLDHNQTVAAFDYDAFGAPLQAVTDPDEILFSAKRLVPGTGKYAFLFRTYDPALGRFMQRDPAGLTDGLNLYTYAGNNPMSYGDPAGLERKELWLGKDIGANFASPDIAIRDPNLGRDDISIYYFTEEGTFLRWSARTNSWIEDYTGSSIIVEKAPEPQKSWLERYMNGVKRGVTAPIHMVTDTAAKVVDMTTQGFAVLGKATGGWDTGYTTWSSTSQAVEAGVSQKELLWQATGGLVVNPIIAVGDVIFTQDPEALGELVGGVMVSGTVGLFEGVEAEAGMTYRKSMRTATGEGEAYTIDGKAWEVQRYPNVKSKITTDPADMNMFGDQITRGKEVARYIDRNGRMRMHYGEEGRVGVPSGARDVTHTHSEIALPSPDDMAVMPPGTTESVLGRAFPLADSLLRQLGLEESGLVMKTTYTK